MVESSIDSIVTVGDGRGFVVTVRSTSLFPYQGEWYSRPNPRSLIITAAHCLPHFPPCHGASYTDERAYPDLIGPLGEAPSVSAECVFVDPIADIAVLAEPDGQALPDEHSAFISLIEPIPAMRMQDPKQNVCPAWLLSLDRQWISCQVEHTGGSWYIRNAALPGIQGGMSGSWILNEGRTAAIGVVCIGQQSGEISTEGGPNPRLAVNLPAWMAPRRAATMAPPFDFTDMGGRIKVPKQWSE